MRNTYSREDRIIAYTMYRTGMHSIGFWGRKRIAHVTGHSADSFSMKIDQFKGIASPRKQTYIEDAKTNLAPGLNQWADADEVIWNEFKDTSLADLKFLAQKILTEKFEGMK